MTSSGLIVLPLLAGVLLLTKAEPSPAVRCCCWLVGMEGLLLLDVCRPSELSLRAGLCAKGPGVVRESGRRQDKASICTDP